MRRGYVVNAGPIIGDTRWNHGKYPLSPIANRCPACGSRLDRAGLDLVYCDRCGREYLARQTKTPRTFHLTPITL